MQLLIILAGAFSVACHRSRLVIIVVIVFHNHNASLLHLPVALKGASIADLSILFPFPDPFLFLRDERFVDALEQVLTDANAEENGEDDHGGEHHEAHNQTLRQIVRALVRCLLFSGFESSDELFLFLGLLFCKFDTFAVQFGQSHSFDACVTCVSRQTN